MIKKLLNKLMRKLGYEPRNKFGAILKELALESARRDGQVMTYTLRPGMIVKVAMFYHKQ